MFWTDVMQVIQDRDSDEPMPDLRDRKAEVPLAVMCCNL